MALTLRLVCELIIFLKIRDFLRMPSRHTVDSSVTAHQLAYILIDWYDSATSIAHVPTTEKYRKLTLINYVDRTKTKLIIIYSPSWIFSSCRVKKRSPRTRFRVLNVAFQVKQTVFFAK